DALDDLFLEGLVVLVVLGAGDAGGHDQAGGQRDRGEPQAAVQRRRVVPHNPAAGFGVAHCYSRSKNVPSGTRSRRSCASPPATPWHRVRIGRDQGAFAAGTPRKESYSRAATP